MNLESDTYNLCKFSQQSPFCWSKDITLVLKVGWVKPCIGNSFKGILANACSKSQKDYVREYSLY